MAKKMQPVDILPAPSSSDDETEDGSSSSTDDEQPPPQQQQPLKPQNQEAQNQESDDDDSDDETEDEDDEPLVEKPSLQLPQKSEESDDDSDDDDSDDETLNSPSASAFTIKPVVSKPVSKSPEPKTPTSKPARVKSRAKRPAESEEKETDKGSRPVLKNQEPGKVKGGNSKRPAEIESEKIDKVSKSKKSKVTNGDGQKVEKGSKSKKVVSGDDEGGEVEVEEKKSIIKWSEKDEDALLGGIIDFKEETGEDVNFKVDTFYEFVKDSISVILSRSQLYEKVKRLKKKYHTNAEKWQNGEEAVFSKPHENRLFELSQKIWGGEGRTDSKVKSSKKKDKKNTSTPGTSRELFVKEEVKDIIMEDKKEEIKDFWSVYPWLCASLESEAAGRLTMRVGDLKEYVNGIISGMGEEKARELEDGWKDIHVMNFQLYAKKARLIFKQAEAVLDSHQYF